MPIADLEERRKYMREWMARRRADFFQDKFCVWCGSIERLELDHIDRSTKVDHRIWSWAEHRRLAELEKCQVLCRPCHEDKSAIEHFAPVPPHGTMARYKSHSHPCKCSDCKRANADWKAENERKRMGL